MYNLHTTHTFITHTPHTHPMPPQLPPPLPPSIVLCAWHHATNPPPRSLVYLQAGLIEEAINDAFDSVEVPGSLLILSITCHHTVISVLCLQPEGLEGEAEAEVDRVMEEITAGLLAPAGSAPTTAPPAAVAKPSAVRV